MCCSHLVVDVSTQAAVAAVVVSAMTYLRILRATSDVNEHLGCRRTPRRPAKTNNGCCVCSDGCVVVASSDRLPTAARDDEEAP